LFGLSPAILRRTRFPLGELTKDEVRACARRYGLAIHDKPESQDICFVPDGDYARVVRAIRPDAFAPGAVRHVDGRVLGAHGGVANFTIGQRRGLGIALGRPAYVSGLDAASGAVTIGPAEAVRSDCAVASAVRWIGSPPPGPFRAEARIRYHHVAAPALVTPLPEDRVAVSFDEAQWAVTPGQALVLYRGDEVLGGGWIVG
jgi:tRNA-specific 2-thiouridylase